MRNGTQHIRRTLALTTAIVALVAPVASAAPVEQMLSDRQDGAVGSSDYPPTAFDSIQALGDSIETSPSPEPSPSPAPASSSADAFDWGDAVIGATVVLALTAIGVGGTVVLRTRPRHSVA